MDRRSFVIGSAAAAAALRTSFAQDAYPTRAITVINPFPPGGAVDVVMRPLAAILEPMVQKPVVIDTKAGAAGQVGAQVAANAKPDGYTLLSHLTSISGSRATSPIPASSSATISSRTRRCRNSSKTPRSVPTRSSSARRDSTARSTFRPPCSPTPPA